ncbi:hypothetical protein FY028_010215 [Cyclobacterium marinum]|nr:hypothetical protein [Cyclobacterium marinum]
MRKDIIKLKKLSELKEFKGHEFFVALVDHLLGKADAGIELLKKTCSNDSTKNL